LTEVPVRFNDFRCLNTCRYLRHLDVMPVLSGQTAHVEDKVDNNTVEQFSLTVLLRMHKQQLIKCWTAIMLCLTLTILSH